MLIVFHEEHDTAALRILRLCRQHGLPAVGICEPTPDILATETALHWGALALAWTDVRGAWLRPLNGQNRTISGLVSYAQARLASMGTPWVVSPVARRTAESRLRSLQAGANAGFRISKTAVTTNRQALQDTAQALGGSWIQKSLVTGIKETGQFLAQRVLWEEPVNPLTKMMPFVYQELLPTKYQVRVACFGDEMVCGAIDVPQHTGEVDVRRTLGRMKFTPYEAPDVLRHHCHALQEELGVAYLSLDVGRMPDEAWCLFDVNTMNDLFWVEQHLPGVDIEAALLRMLKRFLEQGRGHPPRSEPAPKVLP